MCTTLRPVRWLLIVVIIAVVALLSGCATIKNDYSLHVTYTEQDACRTKFGQQPIVDPEPPVFELASSTSQSDTIRILAVYAKRLQQHIERLRLGINYSLWKNEC